MADFKKHLGILMNCYKNFFTQIGFISDCKNMILRAHIRLTSTRAELKLDPDLMNINFVGGGSICVQMAPQQDVLEIDCDWFRYSLCQKQCRMRGKVLLLKSAEFV